MHTNTHADTHTPGDTFLLWSSAWQVYKKVSWPQTEPPKYIGQVLPLIVKSHSQVESNGKGLKTDSSLANVYLHIPSKSDATDWLLWHMVATAIWATQDSLNKKRWSPFLEVQFSTFLWAYGCFVYCIDVFPYRYLSQGNTISQVPSGMCP